LVETDKFAGGKELEYSQAPPFFAPGNFFRTFSPYNSLSVEKTAANRVNPYANVILE
jgi:hypothetical protein